MCCTFKIKTDRHTNTEKFLWSQKIHPLLSIRDFTLKIQFSTLIEYTTKLNGNAMKQIILNDIQFLVFLKIRIEIKVPKIKLKSTVFGNNYIHKMQLFMF